MAFSDSGEGLERKKRSEAILVEAGVAVNAWLPEIETLEETKGRPLLDIARRAICLLLVAATSEIDKESFDGLAEEHGALGHFSEAERAYLDSYPWTESGKIQFSWRSEAAWVLFWALGYVEELGLPTEQASVSDAIDIVNGRNPDWLASNAKPKTMAAVLDEADLIYRCHWAVRQASLDGNSSADQLETGVTLERHYSLNWLIDDSADWDHVDTST